MAVKHTEVFPDENTIPHCEATPDFQFLKPDVGTSSKDIRCKKLDTLGDFTEVI